MDKDKAIRSAKLTLGGMLEKKRAKSAVERAQGQIAPSKYLPGVPRAVHAAGGYVPQASLPVSRVAIAKPSSYGQQPTAIDALSSLASIGSTIKGFSDTVEGEEAPTGGGHHPNDGHDHSNMSEAARAAWGKLTDAYGQPLTVTSAYRDPKRNESVGGAGNSQHLHGNAYDIDTSGMSYEDRLALADMAWNSGFRGIGFYDNSLHFDVGDPRSWGPSYSRDSIPEWALPWAQERYGYGDGGEVNNSDNFQNWFGNSVTHTDGEPHVFYTGTSKDKDFTSFNVGRHGAWFTRDPEVASSYAEQNDSQGHKRDGWNMVKTNTASRVIPAYVRAENPYTGELPPEVMRDNYKAAQSDWFDSLRAKGHDAWIPASQNGNLLVALKEPHQIKSIYNSGKFDPKQKHMNKADGGSVDDPVDLGTARLMRNFNQNSTGPTPAAEGVFNRIEDRYQKSKMAYDAAHADGVFDSVQIGDVYKYKPLPNSSPMEVVGHRMMPVERWGGEKPPKYVYHGHYPVVDLKGGGETKPYSVERMEDRDLYDRVKGKPRIVKAGGGNVDKALAITRSFTKDGRAATMRLKAKGD